MLKKQRMTSVLLLVLILMMLSITPGCTRRTVSQGETLTGQKAVQVADQARETSKSQQPARAEDSQRTTLQEGSTRTPAAARQETTKIEPASQAIKEEPITETAKSPASIALSNLQFEFDKHNLSDDAREILKGHAILILKNTDFSLTIEGHCDERGSNEYNLALGERRAVEAMKYLVALGVNEKKISTVSYGEELPLDPRSNEEAWAKNRRAQFYLTIK
ncbi:MAG: OmpA family protein [Smithellaceae bacterium]|nr:OmpA family protein [Smithellaceae bacterium]